MGHARPLTPARRGNASVLHCVMGSSAVMMVAAVSAGYARKMRCATQVRARCHAL